MVGPTSSSILTALGDTLADVLTALREGEARVAQKKADEEANNATDIAKLDASDAEALQTMSVSTGRDRRLVADWCPDHLRGLMNVRNSPEYVAVNKSLQESEEAERLAAAKAKAERDEAAARTKAERAAKALVELSSWVGLYGSNRLKACVANEWECDEAYQDERLALEFPGWEWGSEVAAELLEPSSPTTEVIALFERARESLSTYRLKSNVSLKYWEEAATTDDDGDEVSGDSGYCCEVNPGDWSSHMAYYGYTGPTSK